MNAQNMRKNLKQPVFSKLKKTTIVTTLLLLFFSSSLFGQSSLSLEEAVQIGLENNFNIQLFENRLEIAKNNSSAGNAGFFPSIELTGSRSETVEDNEFETTQERQTTSGARSTNTAAAINFDWTIFDGLQMFRSYNLLDELENVSDLELRFEMEQLVRSVTTSYYEIIRIENQVSVLENTVDVSLERIEIEETKLDLGSGSEVELLQARSDLNADRAALLRERNILNEAKIALNELLARDPMTEFTVGREIPLTRDLNEAELYERIKNQNAELQLARVEQNVADLEYRRIRGERYPEISLTSGYTFNRTDGGGSFFRFNETRGFTVGITAQFNLFDGFNTNRRVQNAQISRKNSELALRESQIRVESEFRSIYRTYLSSLELVDLERENLSNAEKTLDIALERFRLGDISSLELREAQRTFLAAENRLITTLFEAKIAETQLLQLAGQLPVSGTGK